MDCNSHVQRSRHSGRELQNVSVSSDGNLLGLYDFGARYYDPLLGRWFNIDPALQGLNPYVYCGNNPIMYVDKDGEFFTAFLGFILLGMNANLMVQGLNGHITSVGALFGSMAIGALAGAVSFGVGNALGGIGFISGFFSGGYAGAAGGFITGLGNAVMNGTDPLIGTLRGIGMGALIGSVSGAISGGLQSVAHHGNFWTGAGAVFDQLHTAPVTDDQTVTVHPDLQYTQEFTNNFVQDNFGEIEGLKGDVIVDGSMPIGYSSEGDYVLNRNGQVVDATTEYLGDFQSKVYAYKSAYTSPKELYLTLGHEFIHVNMFHAGYSSSKHEFTTYMWSTAQATKWGMQSHRESFFALAKANMHTGILDTNMHLPIISTNPIIR